MVAFGTAGGALVGLSVGAQRTYGFQEPKGGLGRLVVQLLNVRQVVPPNAHDGPCAAPP